MNIMHIRSYRARGLVDRASRLTAQGLRPTVGGAGDAPRAEGALELVKNPRLRHRTAITNGDSMLWGLAAGEPTSWEG